MNARGIPANELGAAYRLTLPGYGLNVRDYSRDMGQAFDDALVSVNTGIAGRPLPPNANPYSRILRSRSFMPGMEAGLSGLSGPFDFNIDVTTDPALAKNVGIPYVSPTGITPPNKATGWLDVLNTFVGQVSTGIGTGFSNLIGGRAPVVTPHKPEVPWGTIALAGGGVLAAYLLLRRK